MGQRAWLRATAGTLVVLLALTACSSGGTAENGEKKVTLTFGHWAADDHWLAEKVFKPWADKVKEETGGSVTIDIVPGGALGGADVIFENVKSGAQDIGWAQHGATPGKFPLSEVASLPFVFPGTDSGVCKSAEECNVLSTDALLDAYETVPELKSEYKGVKMLGFWLCNPQVLYTKSRKVSKASDLKGLTIRATGESPVSLLQKMGAGAVTFPAAEVYDALSKGVIDGVMTSTEGGKTIGILDQIKYIQLVYSQNASEFFVMNPNSWDKLSADQKAGFERATGSLKEFSELVTAGYAEQSEDGMDAAKSAGAELIPLDSTERPKWEAAGLEVKESWVSKQNAAGRPGQKVLDTIKADVNP